MTDLYRDGFGELRSLLDQPPGPDTWRQINIQLGRMPADERLVHEVLPYLERQLDQRWHSQPLDIDEALLYSLHSQAWWRGLPRAEMRRWDQASAWRLVPQIWVQRLLRDHLHGHNIQIARVIELPSRRSGDMGDELAGRLAEADWAGGLLGLDLKDSGLGAVGASALGASQSLRSLRHLDLGGNALDHAALQGLLGGQGLPSLQHLSLRDARLEPADLIPLLGAPLTRRLQALSLGQLPFVDSGFVEAMLQAGPFALRRLYLQGTSIGEDGLEMLLDARTEAMPHLEHVVITHCPVSDSALRTLAAAHPEVQLAADFNELSGDERRHHYLQQASAPAPAAGSDDPYEDGWE